MSIPNNCSIPFRLTKELEIVDAKSKRLLTVMDMQLGKLIVDFLNEYYWKDSAIETAALVAQNKPILADCIDY